MAYLDQTGLARVLAALKTKMDLRVPQTRKINNKALSADVSLTASDVGAQAAITASGILKGNGSSVSAATAGTDYAAAVHASRHATGGGDAVSPASIGAATRLSGTATLAVASWTGSGPYTYTLAVSGLLAADTPHVDRVTGTTVSTAEAINTAWALIMGYAVKPQTSAGYITFYAAQKPAVAIPIMWEVVRNG
jgi:hypothetical protein